MLDRIIGMGSQRNFWSSLLDWTIATAMLMVVSPVLLVSAACIRATSNGPIILSSELKRPDGRSVSVYRFRTTGPGSAAFQYVGTYLRRFSVDKLPMLWNLLRGD